MVVAGLIPDDVDEANCAEFESGAELEITLTATLVVVVLGGGRDVDVDVDAEAEFEVEVKKGVEVVFAVVGLSRSFLRGEGGLDIGGEG